MSAQEIRTVSAEHHAELDRMNKAIVSLTEEFDRSYFDEDITIPVVAVVLNGNQIAVEFGYVERGLVWRGDGQSWRGVRSAPLAIRLAFALHGSVPLTAAYLAALKQSVAVVAVARERIERVVANISAVSP